MNRNFLLSALLVVMASLLCIALPAGADQSHPIYLDSHHKSDRWKTYKKGSRDRLGVTAIQYLLRDQGYYKGEVSGVFDDKTDAAVRALQIAESLNPSGIVDLRTWPKLVVPVSRGSHNYAVCALQVLLCAAHDEVGNPVYPHMTIDGVFSPAVEVAVRERQETAGIRVDGIVGTRTWMALFNGLG